MNGLGSSFRVTAAGLAAERMRMDVISVNLANANSQRTDTQEAFRSRVAILTATETGPKIQRIALDDTPMRRVLDPGNPFADAQGYTEFSNVQPVREMVNLMSAQRSYEANIAAFNSAKGMIRSALNIGRS
ncbi:MAG: flagellar basal body rod protein FlgC [Fimbriimonadaceae bacterium]|nr:flagellar basal body rod protein FlgC [Fimbriimonadaceae bacterium]